MRERDGQRCVACSGTFGTKYLALPSHSCAKKKGLVEAARGSTKECSEEAQCYFLGRDFSGAVCPGGFITASPGDRWSCRATSDYEGPCSNELVSFDGFTARALEAWSQQCDAYWPCLDLTALDFEAEVATMLYPLSLASTARRLSTTG